MASGEEGHKTQKAAKPVLGPGIPRFLGQLVSSLGLVVAGVVGPTSSEASRGPFPPAYIENIFQIRFTVINVTRTVRCPRTSGARIRSAAAIGGGSMSVGPVGATS
jgi:hypothetical protein